MEENISTYGVQRGFRVIVTMLSICYAFVLCGCGTSGFNEAKPLVNRTNGMATDAQLIARWKVAQQHLATSWIPINAAVADINGTPPIELPPDPRALTIPPCCVAVITVPDIPWKELPFKLQSNTSDPTHIIRCPDGAVAKYCYAYTDGNIFVSKSWVLHDGTTDYEFENVILKLLNYDTSGR